MNLSEWRGVSKPPRKSLVGTYCRLEPLNASIHGPDLYRSSQEPGADDRFRYLFEPPQSEVAFYDWLQKVCAPDDPMFFAVIDQRTGRAEGRQALMRIDPVHGVIEIGNILWGPAIARSTVCTEALFLFAQYVFDELGYRRFEWKCNNDNIPSKKAAIRFGFQFEGIFRNHMVTKGKNRDTAWFAMTSEDWPDIRQAYLHWLAPDSFDETGAQRRLLAVPGPGRAENTCWPLAS
ncbi:GNAT family N-acetyltransferase [Mesorhizobium sp. B2-5-13]|uniref:GNAT family N-acetyltransferase n=1 Tax=unclassified Mesorhizobium TaxID=325217 RepID=UPI001129146F|nr:MULTISPECIES: GNAT family protein [unclassified Mesorhizobium]TPJ78782.1 GNAT family N-acetyltransferase [Mesorhizobium sp. B2-5-13]TPK45010.1 GNAT family N-acetyltransferase [Mesorhizobium sp. B2-5-5]